MPGIAGEVGVPTDEETTLILANVAGVRVIDNGMFWCDKVSMFILWEPLKNAQHMRMVKRGLSGKYSILVRYPADESQWNLRAFAKVVVGVVSGESSI